MQIIKYWSYGIAAGIIGYVFTGITGWSKSGPVPAKGLSGMWNEIISQPIIFISSFLFAGAIFGFLFWFGFKRKQSKKRQ